MDVLQSSSTDGLLSYTVIFLSLACFIHAVVTKKRENDYAMNNYGRKYWQNDKGQAVPGSELPWETQHPQLVDKVPGKTFLVKDVCDRPAIVLSDPESTKKHFKDQMNHIKDPGFGLGYIPSKVLGQSVGAKYGRDWTRVRKPFVHGFTASRVMLSVDSIASDMEEWLDEIAKEGSFPVSERWTRTSLANVGFKVVAKIIYGDDLSPEEFQELVDLKDMLFDSEKGLFPLTVSEGNRMKVPFYHQLPTKLSKQLRRFQTAWRNFNLKRMELCESDEYCEGRNDIFSLVAQGRRKGTIDITEAEFFDTINEMLLANVEVASCVLSWAFVHTSMHPEVQQEMREEVDRVMKDVDNPEGYTHGITWSRLNAMEYVDMVFKESLRIQPPAEYNLPENLPHDEVLDGYLIPAETPVVLNLYMLNRHPDFWPEPMKFKPERFDMRQKEDGTAVKAKPWNDHAYFQFGMGPRKCIGYRYAIVMIKSLLALGVKKYNLSIEGGEAGVSLSQKGTFRGPVCTVKLEKRQ